MLVGLSEEALEQHVSSVDEWVGKDEQPPGFAVERKSLREQVLLVRALFAQVSAVAAEEPSQAC